MALYSINQLSAESGVDRRTIDKYLRLSGAQPGESGKYTLEQFARAMEYKGRGEAPDAESSLEAEKTRLTRHQANLAEIAERKARGEVLELESIARFQENLLISLVRSIRTSGMPQELQDSIIRELKAGTLDAAKKAIEQEKEATNV